MFGKLFGRKTSAEAESPRDASTGIPSQEGRDAPAFDHLESGAEDLVQMLLTAMKTERGVHIESLLGALGSLAGFCAIDSLMKQIAASGRNSRECGLVDVEVTDGSRYYFGDPLNHVLAGTDMSLWSLVAGAVNHLGSEDYPDFAEISGHVARTVGGPEFAVPRVPEGHRPGDLPVNYVRALWPHVLPLLDRRVPTLNERVSLMGLAAQRAIIMGKDVIPAPIAATLVMECAVPMSKLDPASIAA